MSLWPRTLKQKTILVVVLVALLALGNVVTLQAMLRRFDDIGATVNLAGKMRMLSQRIALEALAENLAQGGIGPKCRSAMQVLRSIIPPCARVGQPMVCQCARLIRYLPLLWINCTTLGSISRRLSMPPTPPFTHKTTFRASRYWKSWPPAMIYGRILKIY